jgi:hypothetical protein
MKIWKIEAAGDTVYLQAEDLNHAKKELKGKIGDIPSSVMQMPEVPDQAWKMIQYAKESSEDTVGNDSTFMQGQLGGKGSSAARTATGAAAISAKEGKELL